MVLAWIKKWIDYYKVRNRLKKGLPYFHSIELSNNFMMHNENSVKIIINTEVHKVMFKYDLELNFKYHAETHGYCFPDIINDIQITFTLKK